MMTSPTWLLIMFGGVSMWLLELVFKLGEQHFPSVEWLWTSVRVVHGVIALTLGVILIRAVFRLVVAGLRSKAWLKAIDLRLW